MLRVMLNGGHKVPVLGFERDIFTDFLGKICFFVKKVMKKFGTIEKDPYLCIAILKGIGRLAQLVQSVCLTSRGSAVRIRQRPQSKKRDLFKVSFFVISGVYERLRCARGGAMTGWMAGALHGRFCNRNVLTMGGPVPEWGAPGGVFAFFRPGLWLFCRLPKPMCGPVSVFLWGIYRGGGKPLRGGESPV